MLRGSCCTISLGSKSSVVRTTKCPRTHSNNRRLYGITSETQGSLEEDFQEKLAHTSAPSGSVHTLRYARQPAYIFPQLCHQLQALQAQKSGESALLNPSRTTTYKLSRPVPSLPSWSACRRLDSVLRAFLPSSFTTASW